MRKSKAGGFFSQLGYLGADLRRCKLDTLRDLFYTFFERGVWAVIVYRISRALYLIKCPVLDIFLKMIAFLMSKSSEFFLGAIIDPGTDIGPGLYIGHTGTIIIHYEVRAGKNLSLSQEVTVGTKGVGYQGVPVFGDNVFIGAGAKVLGKISIGNHVKIGANAVVLSDIPAYSTVVGIPGRVVKTCTSGS